LSDSPQVQDCDVSLAALDGADEGAMQTARLGELRLRHAAGVSLVADRGSDPLKKGLVVEIVFHA
jgi:hypothetical protein